MSKATYVCPKCNKTIEQTFEVGKSTSPICPDCKIEMKRQFKNINLSDVVSDEMLHYGQTFLYQ
jgi:protein-arginine kinase activator protein McsA